jgi:hypothetical protein
MPPLHYCPQCPSSSVTLLAAFSHGPWLNYYQCNDCSHVWSLPKLGEDGPALRYLVTREDGRPRGSPSRRAS